MSKVTEALDMLLSEEFSGPTLQQQRTLVKSLVAVSDLRVERFRKYVLDLLRIREYGRNSVIAGVEAFEA